MTGLGRAPYSGQARKIGVNAPKATTPEFGAYTVAGAARAYVRT